MAPGSYQRLMNPIVMHLVIIGVCVYIGMMKKNPMKHGISLWKNVSGIKPRLGVCQFQQKTSIKNYAVLFSKVTTLPLEPVRGFVSKHHVTFFF